MRLEWVFFAIVWLLALVMLVTFGCAPVSPHTPLVCYPGVSGGHKVLICLPMPPENIHQAPTEGAPDESA